MKPCRTLLEPPQGPSRPNEGSLGALLMGLQEVPVEATPAQVYHPLTVAVVP